MNSPGYPMSPAGLLDQVEELVGQFCEVAVPDLMDTDTMGAADQVIRLGMLVLDYRRRVWLLYDDLIKKTAAAEVAAASSLTGHPSA